MGPGSAFGSERRRLILSVRTTASAVIRHCRRRFGIAESLAPLRYHGRSLAEQDASTAEDGGHVLASRFSPSRSVRRRKSRRVLIFRSR